jgi:hypothetical protein
MATVKCWLDLPYGLNENAVHMYSISHAVFCNIHIMVTFCIVPTMRVPISGGIPPC